MKNDKNGARPHFYGTVMNKFCCHCEERSEVAISKKEKKGLTSGNL